VTLGCRELHQEELYNLYSSSGIIRMIKLTKMRWTEHIARMGEMSNVYRTLERKKSEIWWGGLFWLKRGTIGGIL
jgi:hypothetical protein